MSNQTRSDLANVFPRRLPASRDEAVGIVLECILSGEIRDFRSLCIAANIWPEGSVKQIALSVGFDLIRRLHWGFFADLDPDRYPRLWTELVIPDEHYDFAGDLKRNISLPNLYIGMVDLHGYTSFCRENRKNLNRLELLDRVIQDDIPLVVERAGVLSRRVRGDEILLVGGSASDTMEAVLLVAEFFREGRDPALDNAQLSSAAADSVTPRLSATGGSGYRASIEASVPRFEVSAGVAGGQGFTALVVTRDGDLSGDAVNTAARLQSRAGRLSSDRTRVMVTNHVHRSLQAEKAKTEFSVYYRLLHQIDFIDAGQVDFKGLTVSVLDVVFPHEADRRRLLYRESLVSLYEAIEAGLWKNRVFEDALHLASLIAAGLDSGTRRLVETYTGVAKEAFSVERYEEALEAFNAILVAISGEGDALACDYLHGVSTAYERIATAFAEALDQETTVVLPILLGQKELANYNLLETRHHAYVRFREAARQKVRNRKALWYRCADQLGPELSVRLGEPKH